MSAWRKTRKSFRRLMRTTRTSASEHHEYNNKRIRDLLRPLESHYIQDWSNDRLLPYLRCFAGRKFLYSNNCLQNENFKSINIFIINMAMSDLLFPLIFIPLQVVNLYRYSWLISGVLGNSLFPCFAFCRNYREGLKRLLNCSSV